MNKILEAVEFAKLKHGNQLRKDGITPYIRHPLRVAARTMLLDNVTEDMVCAAILHDVLEDTETTFGEIQNKFGDTVAYYVQGLTNIYTKKMFPHWNRGQRKTWECVRLASDKISREIRLIKLLDRIDNLGDRSGTSIYPRYLQESRELLTALTGTDTDLEKELKTIIEELENVT